jgi:CRP-like cAMP-binding protein
LAKTLVAKLRAFGPMTAEEEALLLRATRDEHKFCRGEDLVREGSRPTYSTLLVSGMAGRYNITSEGKRQITSVHVAGDFVDLHSFVLKLMDHSIAALGDCRTIAVPHAALQDIIERSSRLAKLLWLNTLVDGATHRRWLVAMGRLPARQHLAHFICEIFIRYRAIGQTDGMKFELAMSQSDLGDTLGLSAVHVNRSLKELRSEQLVTWERNAVTIRDWDRLQLFADFDPTYLQIDPP